MARTRHDHRTWRTRRRPADRTPGGGFCPLLAPSGESDAFAANYGNWPPNGDELVRSCPIVASHEANDKMLTGDAQRLTEALERGDVPHDVEEYPGVEHSFMNDWRHAPLRLRVFDCVDGFRYSEPEAEDVTEEAAHFGENDVSAWHVARHVSPRAEVHVQGESSP